MKRIVLLLVLLAFVLPASASVRDGIKAYRSGDYATALAAFRPLAEEGDARSQYALGQMYHDGKGVAQDDAKAARWWRLAADQGLPQAQVSLAGLYLKGSGVEKNGVTAVELLQMAAVTGYPAAQHNLGVIYAQRKDMATALMYFDLAAEKGFAPARKSRDKAERRMRRDDVLKGLQMAREWRDKHGR